MHVPTIQGIIDRRILVNYRIDPAVLAKVLPPPFEPKLIKGFGIAGICLIRLKQIRPRHLPGIVGLSSENAAHRIAVKWQENNEWREGVYIPRRDSSSLLNTLIGGRIFPGIHHHATFEVKEQNGHYHVALSSDDSDLSMRVEAETATSMPENSVFDTLEVASSFFEAGSLGYSPSHTNEFDGLELQAFNWKVTPLTVSNVQSSFFEDETVFPDGSVEFDCALLMEGINHEWHAHEPLCVSTPEFQTT